MYNVSLAYMQALKAPVHTTYITGKIGNARTIDGRDFISLTINNRCADSNEVSIGSVYMGELNATLATDLNIIWANYKGTSIELSEQLAVEGGVESVPIGIFYIDEIKRTKQGFDVVAYDAMSKFDKTIRKGDIATNNKTMPVLLAEICDKCNVTLATEDFSDFPNRTGVFSLAKDNDVETYRDLLSWVAQTLGAYATINRDGELELRMYKDTNIFADRIDAQTRADSYSFSSFTTYYTGIRAVYSKTQESLYYSIEPDDGLTYNLGTNPFLQGLSKDRFKAACLNILEGLQGVRYMPFSVETLPTMVYDLGDIIKFSDGAGEDRIGCIMAYDYTFNQVVNFQGMGADPSLANAQSKTDKNLAGILKKTEENKEYLYQFFNDEDIGLASTWQTIFNQRFGTVSEGHAIFQAEILCNNPMDDAVVEVRYLLNNEEVSRYPIETWIAGRHIMSLFYVISTKADDMYLWTVQMRSNANVTILQNEGYGTIRGQGLASTEVWNGYLDFSESYTLLNTSDESTLVSFAEGTVTAITQVPESESISESYGLLSADDDSRMVDYLDVYAFDKEFKNRMTWNESAQQTWDYSEAFYVWGIDY